MARPEEELSVQINYNVSGRTVNYVVAAILGLGGYTFWPSDGNGEEISRLDKPLILSIGKRLDVLEARLTLVSREITIVSAMLSKDNRKLIEKKHD